MLAGSPSNIDPCGQNGEKVIDPGTLVLFDDNARFEQVVIPALVEWRDSIVLIWFCHGYRIYRGLLNEESGLDVVYRSQPDGDVVRRAC